MVQSRVLIPSQPDHVSSGKCNLDALCSLEEQALGPGVISRGCHLAWIQREGRVKTKDPVQGALLREDFSSSARCQFWTTGLQLAWLQTNPHQEKWSQAEVPLHVVETGDRSLISRSSDRLVHARPRY